MSEQGSICGFDAPVRTRMNGVVKPQAMPTRQKLATQRQIGGAISSPGLMNSITIHLTTAAPLSRDARRDRPVRPEHVTLVVVRHSGIHRFADCLAHKPHIPSHEFQESPIRENDITSHPAEHYHPRPPHPPQEPPSWVAYVPRPSRNPRKLL